MPKRRNSNASPVKPQWTLRLIAVILGIGTFLAVVYVASSQPKRMTAAEVTLVLNAAEKSVASGNPLEARRALAPLARTSGLDARTLLRAAQIAIESDASELAEDLLTKLDAAGRPKEAQFLRGVLALRHHRARDAERWWRETVAVGGGPTVISAWERLCQLYMTQIRGNDLRWAMEGLSQTRRLTLDELVVYTTAYEPYYSSEERLGMVRQYSAADPADIWSRVAVSRYQRMQGDTAGAMKTLDAPGTADTYRVLLASRIETALERDVEQAVKLLPNTSAGDGEPLPIARVRGLIAFRQRDWETSAGNLRRVAQLQPLDTQVLYQLGQALERIDQRDLAESLLRRVQKQEQLNNLVFRIRKTTHLPVARLAPLVLDVCGLLADLDRGNEGMLWLTAIADPAVDPATWQAAKKRLATAGVKPEIELPSFSPNLLSTAKTATSPSSESRFSGGHVEPLGVGRSPATNESPSMLSRIQFEERQDESGLNFKYESGAIGQKWLLETLGGGIAVIDYDNDGWPDVYFAQGGPLQTSEMTPASRPGDRLYRNLGDGRFEDVTEQAHLGDKNYSHGCTAGDFDNDGDADLLVANFGNCVLYRNEGDGTFTDISHLAGFGGTRWHTSAAFDDLDRDGNLDLYIVTYVGQAFQICRRPDGSLSACSPANYSAEPDVLYRNRGDGTFEDISESVGIQVPSGKGLGIVVADLNTDGRPDIYVTNDGTPNFFFRNNGTDSSGKLRFEEIAMRSGCAVNAQGQAQAGMGISCADFNSDGLLDLVTTNFFNEGATYYQNHGEGFFEDVSATSGLLEPTRRLLGFGIQSVDFDNSGRLGLVIANGHIDDFGDRQEPWKMRPQGFVTDGRGRFQEITWRADKYFSQEMLGRVVARLDFDRDLRADLAVTHLDRPAALLKNTTEAAGRAISFDLVGVQSNRDGRGSRVTVTNGDTASVYELASGDGYMACNERRLIIGVGSAETVDIRIHWPDGEDSTHTLPADSQWTVVEGAGLFRQTR